MDQQPRPCFNLLSILAPFLSLPGAIVIICVEDYFFHEHPAHYIKTAAMTIAGFLMCGFFLACIALARRERSWGITALGIALNAPFMLIAYWRPWDGPF